VRLENTGPTMKGEIHWDSRWRLFIRKACPSHEVEREGLREGGDLAPLNVSGEKNSKIRAGKN